MSGSDGLLALSSVELRRRIGSKEISPVELMDAAIWRIEALNPAVNAIAATDFARARKLAAQAEADARNGEQLGPLHGLPTGIKALEGKSALVLDRVARDEGQVKLDGQVWTARPLSDGDVYEPGESVTVMHIDGATAVVFRHM